MSSATQAAGSGFPVCGILGLIFVTLKLLGVITWSWWWVTAPFWGPIALWLVVAATAMVIAFIVAVVSK